MLEMGGGVMRGLFRGVFFFQAEDGIRGGTVTGVQTCALPIFMTIAARFEAMLSAVDDPHLAGAELLPERLALACARMLPVDGAGLSVADHAGQRIPDRKSVV